jgi:A/G-specific adenine glycosylase
VKAAEERQLVAALHPIDLEIGHAAVEDDCRSEGGGTGTERGGSAHAPVLSRVRGGVEPRARIRAVSPRLASAPAAPPAHARALSGALVRWVRRDHRDLPWRLGRDPYAIWVSEIMLQQTRVEVVVPYYERFLERFPDVEALAAAPLDDVLRAWAGLGYYRRARQLHAAAAIVARDHHGRLPADEAALRALPGIGRYTAGAIRSIAFGEPAPIVDGNVARVLSRLFALPGGPGDSVWERRLWTLAGQLVPATDPSAFNQGLMELGATVCTPRSPRCAACPLARHCRALAEGRPEAYPPPRPRPKLVSVARPAWCSAAIRNPVAIPTDSMA